MLFLSLLVFGFNDYCQNDVGGFSLGVGGAPIGLSNSVECGLVNPAAFASTGKLKFFTGYKLTRGKSVSVAFPDDTSRTDYVFPDYLGVVFPFGKDFFLGLSLSVPYRSTRKYSYEGTVVDESDPRGFREISIEMSGSERFYFLNTTIGKAINDKFSIGVNLGGFRKGSSWSTVAGDTVIGNVVNTMDKYGIEPCLGLQYKANDLLSFGFIIKKGFGKAYRENINGTVSSVESDESLPLVLGLGTGINLTDKIYLNVSGEYILWTLAYSEGYIESDDYRDVIRVHLGGQYRFNDFLSISTGFYTEPSPVKIDSDDDPGSYDQMFLSGGVGIDFGRITLNLGAASSAIIKKEPSFKEENHLNISLVYK